MPSLLYLHGFNSSPASIKAQQTAALMEALGLRDQFICPALPYDPAQAAGVIAQVLQGRDLSQTTVVGSSLGGFYATWVAERYGCQAVLINPAVHPHLLLAPLLGPQRNMYSELEYTLSQAHLDSLREMEPALLHPERYWVLLETGDETLDYRDAVAYYAGARQSVVEGGDHSLQSWPQFLPKVLAHAGFGLVV